MDSGKCRAGILCLTPGFLGSDSAVAAARGLGDAVSLIPLLLGPVKPRDIHDARLRSAVTAAEPIPFQAEAKGGGGREWPESGWAALLGRLKRPATKRATSAPTAPGEPPHVCLFCSPDKLFEIKSLRGKLQDAGGGPWQWQEVGGQGDYH